MEAWLDRALKQYGASEPRTGLESRVLANIRAERGHAGSSRWSWRPALLVLAAMLVIGAAALLMRNRGLLAPTSMANHPAIPAKKSPNPLASNHTGNAKVAPVAAPASRSRSFPKATSVPRLDQFPSPQPLSEQEKILSRYLEQFPREAVLMAEAQTELLKNEAVEQQEGLQQDEIPPDSQRENPLRRAK